MCGFSLNHAAYFKNDSNIVVWSFLNELIIVWLLGHQRAGHRYYISTLIGSLGC